jgi:KaiC/GvpD/RAD55 family RecA-like ATPase
MNDVPAEAAAEPVRPGPEVAEEIARGLGIPVPTAQRLADAGHTTVDSIKLLGRDALVELGVDGADADRIRAASDAAGVTRAEKEVDDRMMARMIEGGRPVDRNRRKAPPSGKSSTDVLRKWVDGDDHAMEAWIQSSEVTNRRPIPAAPAPSPSPLPPAPTPEAAPTEPSGVRPAPAAPGAAQVLEREETVVRWLTDLLDRVKSDQFDPQSLLQEVQELNRTLYEERAKRKQLEDEVEHVKRGSIAVIKYVRGREAKAREQAVQQKDAEIAELKLKLLTIPSSDGASTPPAEGGPAGEAPPSIPAPAVNPLADLQHREEVQAREQAFVERESEFRRRIVQLEGEVRALRAEGEARREHASLLAKGTALPQEIAERMQHLETRDRELVVRENELRTKFEEIRITSEEIERQRGPLQFKENELAAWERQLQTTKQALELEARRIEAGRNELEATGGGIRPEEAKKLEDLRSELAKKDQELRARETFVHQQMQEIETLQRKAATFEADEMHLDIVQETKATKVRSGVRRLDDLMFGGLPPAAQALINGPVHTGKDVLARMFVAEGLKGGTPAIWVVTDKTYTQIRDEMLAVLPQYGEAEAKGLVRYADIYSRTLGVTQAEPGVKLLAPTDKAMLEQLTQVVNGFGQEFRDKFPGKSYRLVFETVSTLAAYLDTSATFRFLQPFSGRRRMDGAASYYVLETGMHTESDLQTLEHMTDGSVNLKLDQLKTFLSIRGLGEVQSRAWVGYTFSKKSFSLGSFSLDHIR